MPDSESWEPRWPRTTAFLVATLAGLTLLWPLVTGRILFGGLRSDMFIAGYAFRLFGAQEFAATGAIPQWNPYLFGGLPYIAAMHGDIFYPTAWLRWIMPVDLAITYGMALHFVLVGWFTYLLGRALGLGWTAAMCAGVAYELSGIVASQMSPGHDGKLFVSALAPLAFLVLLRAVRDGARWAFGAFALVVALVVLGHYQMGYFLMIALGLWTLYLAFWDGRRERTIHPWLAVGLAALAVVVGIAITALQVLPFLEYIPWSPRAAGGPNTGWQWATSYAMPPAEVFSWLLPEFNGVLDKYWGANPIKFHTEYLGVLPVALACFAWGDRPRRRLVVALLVGAALFQLFAFAGHTPFYRPFFELIPMLDRMRAMGMVFFLVALAVSLLAGIGLQRILARQVAPKRVIAVMGAITVLALLGLLGALQVVAEALAIPERMSEVQANAPDLRLGSLRLLASVLVGGGVLWGVAAARIRGAVAAAAVLVATAADLWSVDRRFYTFSPRAGELFRDDAITSHLKQVPQPYRVLDMANAYPQSTLMAYRIPSALGYHGNELRFYQELAGKEQGWRNLLAPNLIDLLAIRFLILPERQPVPGFHEVLGPVQSSFGVPAVLYERDTAPAYARVAASAVKIPEARIPPTVVDPRFPASRVVLYPDTASLSPAPLAGSLPESGIRASVAEWRPGAMRITLTGRAAAPAYLLVSENWYPDWRATVDGRPAAVHRGDHSLLSVALPPGAAEVRLEFRSDAYAAGKLVSLGGLGVALAMLLLPLGRRRREPSGA
ncbi:MAG TPA: hypothetical protein VNK43_09740 [Gemmatimonadales bacterium]|nr:hypothetical protein [Gemmatimonadales bacterium]